MNIAFKSTLTPCIASSVIKGELNPKPLSITIKPLYINGYLVVLLMDSGHNLDILVQTGYTGY